MKKNSLPIVSTFLCGNTHVSGVSWFADGSGNEFMRCATELIPPANQRKKTNEYQSRKVPIVWASVVPAADKNLASFVRMLSGMRPLRFRKDLACPLRITPKPARSVGDDRLAAALGALFIDDRCGWAVLDAGTALTANLVLPPNRFEGGWIVPGLELSLRALADGTAQLPDISAKPRREAFQSAPLGRSTKDALLFGAAHMQTAFARSAVSSLMAEARRLGVNDTRVVLTGGGAESLALSLKEFSPTVEPYLAHLGLLWAWSLGNKPRASRRA